jgi:MFS family permease
MAATDDEAAAVAPRHRVGGYAWYALGVLVLVYIINFVDRQILSILVADVQAHLGVTEAEIGFLYGTAFAVFYALFGIPLGRLADSWYRGRLMAMGLALWSSMTVFSGFANTLAMLTVARIGVGIGEASASPAAYSLISDRFPKERRATALSIYSSGLYIGGALSLPIGGAVASGWNRAYPDAAVAPFGLVGWQAAFVAVGLPGLILALWVLTLREPQRGAIDGTPQPVVRPNAWRDFGRELFAILPPLTLFNLAALSRRALGVNVVALALIALAGYVLYRVTGNWPQWSAYGLGIYAVFSWIQSLRYRDPATYALIWGNPTVVILVIAFGSIAFVSYSSSFWFPRFAEATFYAGPQSPGYFFEGMAAKTEVGLILGVSNGISAALGVIGGGYLSDLWRERDERGRIFVNMLAAVLPLPLIAFMVTTESLLGFYIASPIAHLLGSLWVGAAVATLQDLVLPRMRATAGATYILGTTMVGLALGPYYSGQVAAKTGSLGAGIFALFAMPPLTLLGLWIASRRISELEATKEARAEAAGAPVS